MVSTTGSTLLPQAATNAYITHLLPQTTLLTPNLPEALLLAKLAGREFGNVEDLTLDKRRKLAAFLSERGQWVLLKGGHLAIERDGKKTVVDILMRSNGYSREFVSDFSMSSNTHGTGCTLACKLSSE